MDVFFQSNDAKAYEKIKTVAMICIEDTVKI